MPPPQTKTGPQRGSLIYKRIITVKALIVNKKLVGKCVLWYY